MGALALSVLLHIPLLFLLPSFFSNQDGLEPTQFDPNREFALTVVEEERDKEDEEDPERDGQFISVEAPEREERPDEARFLDQFESKAEKDMARRDPGRQQQPGAATSQPNRPSPAERSSPRHEQPTPPSEEPPQPDTLDEERAEAPDTPETDKGAADVELTEETSVDEGLVDEGAESDQPKKADARKLFPSLDSASAALGGGSIDYLRDVEEGDKTMLNRKKSRYWTFMNRLKEQVAEEWSPGEEYRRRDPHGKVYGVKDRFTNLRITLNGDGSLRSLYVQNPSGLDFYDKEAVRAVKKAAPFLNPPEGLKDEDGLIHLSFGFMLDVRSGSMRNINIRRR